MLKLLASSKFLFPKNYIILTLIYKTQSNRAYLLKWRSKKFLIEDFFAHLFKHGAYGLYCLFGLKSFLLILYFLKIKKMSLFLQFSINLFALWRLLINIWWSFLKILGLYCMSFFRLKWQSAIFIIEFLPENFLFFKLIIL